MSENSWTSSVEAYGRWLDTRPRFGTQQSAVATTLDLDEGTNSRLLYLARRFGVPKRELAADLLRSATKDVFDVIPGDPVPDSLIPDLHDAGIDPLTYKFFDLDGADREGLEEDTYPSTPSEDES